MSDEMIEAPVETPKSPLTMKRLKRRIEKIDAMEDEKKAKTARRRLGSQVLTAIAEGTVSDPRKAAALVMRAKGE